MPKVDWDEVADGSPWEYEYDTGPYDYPIRELEDDGFVHAIEEADKYGGQEVYTMLCGRTLDHVSTVAVLHKPVDCLFCLAEGG